MKAKKVSHPLEIKLSHALFYIFYLYCTQHTLKSAIQGCTVLPFQGKNLEKFSLTQTGHMTVGS